MNPTRWQQTTAQTLGLAHVGVGLADQITHVVERMHGTISRSPLPWGEFDDARPRGITGLVYRSLHASFRGLDQTLAAASRALADGPSELSPGLLGTVAAINGVWGDALAEQDSPMAIPMQRLCPQHRPQARREILFIHGLCLSEQNWQGPAHSQFLHWAQTELDAEISYLRYNTGRSIAANGRSLAELVGAGQRPLLIVGHSMGGLIARSALAQADCPAVTGLAMLGSPHYGAPLERAGETANGYLKFSPYLKPFSLLGAARSAGIQDLRHGLSGPLPSQCRHLLLAGTLSATLPAQAWQARHDYLVPAASALGLSRDPAKALHSPQLQRELLAGVNHLDLLRDAQVYRVLRDWLIAAEAALTRSPTPQSPPGDRTEPGTDRSRHSAPPVAQDPRH